MEDLRHIQRTVVIFEECEEEDIRIVRYLSTELSFEG